MLFSSSPTRPRSAPNTARPTSSSPRLPIPYVVLNGAGVAIEFASPAGAWTSYDAYDPNDAAEGFLREQGITTAEPERKLAEVDAADYDAILVPGGLVPWSISSAIPTSRAPSFARGPRASWCSLSLVGVDIGDAVNLRRRPDHRVGKLDAPRPPQCHGALRDPLVERDHAKPSEEAPNPLWLRWRRRATDFGLTEDWRVIHA